MVGRLKIFRTPEELKELQKQRRKKNAGYFKIYQKYYYLKKILEDKDYNKKNYSKRKLRSSTSK
jgi:hypothetical protein